MLQRLTIDNFVLIDKLAIDWKEGFTAITGETGSGKSILLHAIDMILGERADFSTIGNFGDRSVVEAYFDISKHEYTTFFQTNELENENPVVVRREIHRSGKSRAFINDTPVGLNVLRAFTEGLINVHSQYNTLELRNRSKQLEFFDILAGLESERSLFKTEFEVYQTLQKRVDELRDLLRKSEERRDYAQFQLEELSQLQLSNTDFESLENELKRLENAEDIQSSIQQILSILEGDNGVLQQVYAAYTLADKKSNLDPLFENYSARLRSVSIELKDVLAELSTEEDNVLLDDEKLQLVQEKISNYNRLLRKHHVTNQSELMAVESDFSNELKGSEQLQEELEEAEVELKNVGHTIWNAAHDLHAKRMNSVSTIELELTELLSDLKLPDTKVKFVIDQREELDRFGSSSIQFTFSANKGVEPIPIERAASGGELGRVMLALQKMISSKRQLPTILFDEIDTGVSGDVAQKIGALLSRMSGEVQLIAITHLPQVAAKANNQLRVAKQKLLEDTRTTVTYLNEDERVAEIARLMSGEVITDAALANAKDLMA